MRLPFAVSRICGGKEREKWIKNSCCHYSQLPDVVCRRYSLLNHFWSSIICTIICHIYNFPSIAIAPPSFPLPMRKKTIVCLLLQSTRRRCIQYIFKLKMRWNVFWSRRNCYTMDSTWSRLFWDFFILFFFFLFLLLLCCWLPYLNDSICYT